MPRRGLARHRPQPDPVQVAAVTLTRTTSVPVKPAKRARKRLAFSATANIPAWMKIRPGCAAVDGALAGRKRGSRGGGMRRGDQRRPSRPAHRGIFAGIADRSLATCGGSALGGGGLGTGAWRSGRHDRGWRGRRRGRRCGRGLGDPGRRRGPNTARPRSGCGDTGFGPSGARSPIGTIRYRRASPPRRP